MLVTESALLPDRLDDSQLSSSDFQTISVENQVLLDQVERILHSEELRGSGVLRRLLKFLAEKSITGDADELKEYTVAVDGLGKPSSYDPRHDSAARIQVGRLRQKLADYYRGEGEHDHVVIDIPKGRFKLKCESRDRSTGTVGVIQIPDEFTKSAPSLWQHFTKSIARARLLVVICAGTLIALALGAVYNWLRPANATAKSAA